MITITEVSSRLLIVNDDRTPRVLALECLNMARQHGVNTDLGKAYLMAATSFLCPWPGLRVKPQPLT